MRCARENETAPVRQKLPGSVLFFLNYKPEYVPNTLCKSGIYATFSDKKFSPFGRPFFKKLPHHGRFGFIDDQLALVFVIAENAAVAQHHTLFDGL